MDVKNRISPGPVRVPILSNRLVSWKDTASNTSLVSGSITNTNPLTLMI
jgi:hypothetical protein